MDAYRSLEQKFARIGILQDVTGILNWDTETLMPDGAADSRAEQVATLEAMSHTLLTGADTSGLLNAASERMESLDDWQKANLREMRRSYLHASAVPEDLVEASSKAASQSVMAWRQARKAKDFKSFLPYLKEVLNLQRQIGQCKAEALSLPVYDALLDGYDPGLRQARIDPLFNDLRAKLPGLIAAAQ